MDKSNKPQFFGIISEPACQYFAKVEIVLQSAFLLVFRLSWGWQFFITGKGKLLNHDNVTEFFSSLGIPAPGINAWFIGGLECCGGLLLLLGLLSRPVALLLSAAMSVAYLADPDDRAKVFNILHDPAPFLAAEPFFFLLTAVLVLCFGPGLVSLDAIIAKWWGRTKSTRDRI